MIIIFPLIPVLIAVFLLVAALLNEVASAIDTIITIAWILVIVLSVILIICNIFTKASIGNKIFSSFISVVATIITLIESKKFLFGLVASSDTTSIMGTIEFAFVLLFGGCIWILCVLMCSCASLISIDSGEFDNWNYLKAIALIFGSLLLGGYFGLLG